MFDCTPQILIMYRDFIRRGAHYTPAALRVGDGVRYPARRVCGTMPSIVPCKIKSKSEHTRQDLLIRLRMGGGFRHIPFGIFSVGFHQGGAAASRTLAGTPMATMPSGPRCFPAPAPRGHHGIFTHHGAVHHRGVHTDQSAVPHRTAMHHCTVADGYIFADRYPQVWPGVQHGVVLDIAVFANADGAGISAHHRAVPHAAAQRPAQHPRPGWRWGPQRLHCQHPAFCRIL